MKHAVQSLLALSVVLITGSVSGQPPSKRDSYQPPPIQSSWDDLTDGLETQEDWRNRRQTLERRFLELIRDQHKPEKPPRDIQWHESVVVDGTYTRKLISYNVEQGERARAYLGIPKSRAGKTPAIVALHGTYDKGKQRTAGLVDNPDKAYLDHLCRRGYVVIAPEHFVSGDPYPSGRCLRHRAVPPETSGVDGGRRSSPTSTRLPLTCRKHSTWWMEIYDLEKAPQNFAFYVHGRGHSVAHESRQLMYGWMDTHLKLAEATQAHLVDH